jgi:beta-glucosidase
VDAVRGGEVDEVTIDEHLRRLLRLAERVGALGPERHYPADLPAPDSEVRRQQLTRLAAQGMTVLTNRDDLLPLSPGARVALVGRHAVETVDMGGGSAQVNPPYQVSVAEGLRARLGDQVTVTDGVEVRTRPLPARPGFVVDPETGEPGVHLVVLAAGGRVLEERHGAPATTVAGVDDDYGEPVVGLRFRARVPDGGELEVGTIGVGTWLLAIGDGSGDAGERESEYPLRTSGRGFAEELLAPPFRTLAEHLDAGDIVEATVTLGTGDGEDGSGEPVGFAGSGRFELVARPVARAAGEVVAEAARAAASADVAVVVVGLTEEQETEAVDKTTLALPGEQDALVSAVAAAAPRTVVVVNAATPVIMRWLDEVDAVLWAGLPGQEGGHAVAAALLGDVEPAGRLVTTFPAADGGSPAWSVTPTDGDLVYAEGPYIGYRGYDANKAAAPAFWFGHGLGYTTWGYAHASVLPGAGAPVVSVTVTNSGSRRGREVVQVYHRPANRNQPVRLVGWTAVEADPGQSVRAEIRTDARMWRRWDVQADAWAPLGPGGRLLVARGLGDVRASLELP